MCSVLGDQRVVESEHIIIDSALIYAVNLKRLFILYL